MVTFYARFCERLSTLAEPLYELTRSSVPFKWTKIHSDAFEKVKEEIASERVLVCNVTTGNYLYYSRLMFPL